MKIPWLKAAPLLALNVVFWIAYAVMVGALWAIGVPLIWWAARRDKYRPQFSVVWPERVMLRWHFRWMNPVWGNEQEGIAGLGASSTDGRFFPQSVVWWPAKEFASLAARIIEWSMFRNSTNNLRFMHYFVPKLGWLNPNTIEPSRIRWAGTDAPLQAVLDQTAREGESWQGSTAKFTQLYDVRYVRRFAALFVSQGLYAGLRIAVRFRGRAHQIWFGWKLNPGMAVEGWWPDDPCWKGVGFTCGQVRHST